MRSVPTLSLSIPQCLPVISSFPHFLISSFPYFLIFSFPPSKSPLFHFPIDTIHIGSYNVRYRLERRLARKPTNPNGRWNVRSQLLQHFNQNPQPTNHPTLTSQKPPAKTRIFPKLTPPARPLVILEILHARLSTPDPSKPKTNQNPNDSILFALEAISPPTLHPTPAIHICVHSCSFVANLSLLPLLPAKSCDLNSPPRLFLVTCFASQKRTSNAEPETPRRTP